MSSHVKLECNGLHFNYIYDSLTMKATKVEMLDVYCGIAWKRKRDTGNFH